SRDVDSHARFECARETVHTADPAATRNIEHLFGCRVHDRGRASLIICIDSLCDVPRAGLSGNQRTRGPVALRIEFALAGAEHAALTVQGFHHSPPPNAGMDSPHPTSKNAHRYPAGH